MPESLPCNSKQFRRLIFWAWACLFLLPWEASAGTETLQDRILDLVNQSRWRSGFWGIYIVSLESGKVLASYNANKRFIPASSAKLFIGAAALEELGPDFRFETSVYAEGRLDVTKHQLQGNLVLVGSGDPNLDGRPYLPEERTFSPEISPFIVKIVDELQAQGIRSILGDVIADESYFVREPWAESWTLEDLAWAYGAPVSALALNENCFSVRVLPGGTVSAPAILRLAPANTGIRLVNHVHTASAKSAASLALERSPDGQSYVFEGEIPERHSGLQYTLALNDAADFAARQLKMALEQRQITVSGKAMSRELPRVLTVDAQNHVSLAKAQRQQRSYAEADKLVSVRGVPLAETLKRMMKSSRNLYAEMLLRDLGARILGVGSIETGVSALGQFLQFAGVEQSAWWFSDASGLSRKDLVTPESVVKLLVYMHERPSRHLFRSLLPLSGTDGTLKSRMREEDAARRIAAKTGSIDFVSALAGYISTRKGEDLAFSIMANHQTAPQSEVRSAIDEICRWILNFNSDTGGDFDATRN